MRRANFDDELVILERLIEGTDAAQGFEMFKNRVNDASSRHISRKRITINNPSWINNDVNQAIAKRQRAYQDSKLNNTEESNAKYATAKKQVKRSVKQANIVRKQTLQRSVKATRNASSRILMKEE